MLGGQARSTNEYSTVPHLLRQDQVVDELVVIFRCRESRQRSELRDQLAVLLAKKERKEIRENTKNRRAINSRHTKVDGRQGQAVQIHVSCRDKTWQEKKWKRGSDACVRNSKGFVSADEQQH